MSVKLETCISFLKILDPNLLFGPLFEAYQSP
jgi:hypothetical protein